MPLSSRKTESASTELPPVCQAIRRLRQAANQNQQAFATTLDTAVNSVTRWEIGREPDLWSALKLQDYAHRLKQPDAAEAFETYIKERWPLPPNPIMKAFSDLCATDPAFRRGATAGYIRMGLSELRSETEKTLATVRDDRIPHTQRIESAIQHFTATIGVLDSLLRGADDLAE